MEKKRITNYWTERSHEFMRLRSEEQQSETGRRWLAEITGALPKGQKLRILDVGCGTGLFALMLSEIGHETVGIDLTEHMIYHAKELAERQNSRASFFVMDAENLAFPDGSFDAVVSRNLTWTLPNPEKAYREWLRVLKTGGILLNFDGDYGLDDFTKDGEELPGDHAHHFVSQALMDECEAIKDGLEISRERRPAWDRVVLEKLGCGSLEVDTGVSGRIYTEKNQFYNPTPLFRIRAVK